MKIGIVASVPETLEVFFPPISEQFERLGHEVLYASSRRSNKLAVFPIPYLSRRPKIRNLVGAHQLGSWIKKESLDMVLLNTAGAGFTGRLLTHKATTVYFCHGLHWSSKYQIQSIPARLAEALLLHRVDAVICMNEEDLAWFRERTTVPILYLPRGIGVPLEDFPPVSALPVTKEIVMCWAGELTSRKRPQDAINVVRLLKDWGYNPRLRMAGTGPLHPLLVAKIKKFGLEENVSLRGYVDMKSFLGESGVLLSTSRWEGKAVVVMEALVSGLPVVSYKVKGISDLGETFFSETADPRSLAVKLIELMLRGAVPQREVQDFSRADVAVSIASFLSQLPAVKR